MSRQVDPRSAQQRQGKTAALLIWMTLAAFVAVVLALAIHDDVAVLSGISPAGTEKALLAGRVYSAVDASGTLKLEDILQRDPSFFSDTANRGVSPTTRAAFWLRIAVPSLDPGEYGLSLELTRARNAILFIPDDEGYRQLRWQRGDWSSLTRYPIFALDGAAIAGKTLYLRTVTSSSMRAMLHLSPLQSLIGSYSMESVTLGILAGVLVGLAVYIGVMAATLRDRLFGSLVGVIVAFTCYMLADRGILDTHILPGAVTLASVVSLSATVLTYAALLTFARYWLEIRSWSASLDRALNIVTIGFGILAAETARETLMGDQFVRLYSAFAGVLALALCLGVALVALRRVRTRAILFLLGWSPAIATAVLRLALDLFPSVGDSALFANSLYVGATASLLCYGVLVSDSLQHRERRLRQRAELMETRFRNFADSAADSFWETTAEGDIRYLEGPQFDGLKLEVEQPLVQSLAAISRHSDTALAQIRENLGKGLPFRDITLVVSGPDGRSREVLISGTCARDPRGRLSGFAGTLVDATERDAHLQQSARREKMAALGQMAAFVAHEINNLLHPIMSLSRQARRRAQDDKETARLLDSVIDLSEDMRDMVVSLRSSTAVKPPDTTLLPLSAAVRRSLATVRTIVPPRIVLTDDIAELDHPLVHAGEALQVIANLVANAMNAIENEGFITVSLVGGVAPRLTVQDSGFGMPQDTAARAFEPFFTTRSESGGTGLGLSVVAGLLKSWGATVRIDSELGKGTSVHITFVQEGTDP
ncbi:signal transduction histidine kinase [Devosia subaequoris]|uniref:histidine kinase n=1 Tax=Devosia subaequoris TaxID=395930 RepID=A0A7W6IQL2_9HYPH|nr:ATP-binding protein [Devosia subaequoris]MBB4053988.1 signal transduction histidine kinase [Devosia subaequoris]MCP1211539.1 ATP-binding protein [Devosia subaequoris]